MLNAMTPDAASDNVRFYRSPHIDGLELVTARYRRRAFPRHWHEEYVMGAMTAGAEKLAIRGGEQVVGRGCLILIEPGEPHANAAVDDHPFGYAVVYLPVPLMAGFIRAEAAVGDGLGVRFAHSAPYAPDASRILVRAHARLIASESPLDQESVLVELLSALMRGGHINEAPVPAAVARQAVREARDHIDGHFCEPVSLCDLADLTGASPFHLLRSFRSHVGLPPAAYQNQLRIEQAKRLLRTGHGIADTAAAVGFSDQSHLTRHFQRIVGTTPGRYLAQ
jgi:AraC-like DNA-binding protein